MVRKEEINMRAWTRHSWAACAAALALLAWSPAWTGESNVALSGTATQSSEAFGGSPGKAIDGNTDGIFGNGSVTHTAGEPNPWWQVDLGQTYPIDRIVIWNRADCCQYRLSNFRISIRDATEFEVWGEDLFTDLTYPLELNYEYIPPALYEGQIVRITILGPSGGIPPDDPSPVASFAEVEVWADISGADLAITRQPAGGRTYDGRTFTFSVAVLDEAGVTYQWKKDGEVIPGATGSSYTICSTTGDDSGSYTATANRGAESATSNPADLLVIEGNLALAGTASQSSTGWDGMAARAIDGNIDGVYGNNSVTHTNDGAPWWQLDLPVTGTIDTITIWGRTDDCCMARLTNFQVTIYDAEANPVHQDIFFDDLSFPDTRVDGYAIDIGGVDGKTVKIERLGPDSKGEIFLSLAEVEVFGTYLDPLPDRGYASRRPASQSSTLASYTASFAVDGDRGNFTHTWSGDTLNPHSWEVDLCAAKEIATIILWNRADCCQSRLRDITVAILDKAGGAPVWESDLLNPDNVMGGGVEGRGPVNLVLDLKALTGGTVSGAAVRVTRTPDVDFSGVGGFTNSPDEVYVLSLAEVEVFGPMDCPADGDTFCNSFSIDGPGVPGDYTITADSIDETGDPIWYTYKLDDGIRPPTVIGPLQSGVLTMRVAPGSWTVTMTADDGFRCGDTVAEAACSEQVDVAGDPDNVALRGIATQSSTGFGGFPERAIDGITSGFWADGSISHTADDDPTPWWQVKLDQTYTIDRIVIWGRTDCCMERLTNFRVSVLDEDEVPVYQEDFYPDGATFPDVNLGGFEVPVGDDGRIVKIEMLGPSVLYAPRMWGCFAEVEVFKTGEVITPPDAPRNLAATAGVKKVDLAWEAPAAGAPYSGYAVYRGGTKIADLPSTQLAYTDAPLPAGAEVCYVVATFQEAVKGGDSNGSCATPLDDVVVTGFRRGDVDGSGVLDLSDPIFSLTFQFMGGSKPGCMDAADADDSGTVDLSDPIFSLTFQFMGGTPPPAPGPTTCGPDPTTVDQYVECTYTKC